MENKNIFSFGDIDEYPIIGNKNNILSNNSNNYKTLPINYNYINNSN